MNENRKRTLINCHDLSFAYEGKTALAGLDFAVEEGDYLCVAGENGAGKSTLVKGLLGLLKPASGVLTLDRALKRGIGYLPQQTAAQKNFPAGVEEVVLSGFIGRRPPLPFYTASEKRTARLHMETLGVAGGRRCFGELSGGQQRRVLLARALCATETMLVLDEPAASLDPPAAKALYALLDEINLTRYITIIMVTHDITSALESAGKVLHLQGRQLFFGTTSEYAESGPGRLFIGGKQ